jgi:hypothetical protein
MEESLSCRSVLLAQPNFQLQEEEKEEDEGNQEIQEIKLTSPLSLMP